MKYPESLLSTDESVVFDVHHHLFVLWKPAALIIAFVAMWMVVLFLATSSDWVVFAGLFVLFFLALFMAWRVQVWAHTNLVLTDQRLIYQTGVFTRRSREIPLAKINDVSFIQMVLGRMLGMGDLVVESASESGPFAYFNMPDPARLKTQVLEHIMRYHVHGEQAAIAKEVAMAVEKHQPTGEIVAVPPERPPIYSEIVDQIERLDALRERGVLTDDEFEQAKGALLDKLSGGQES
jgi:uncharacterized membrane protein YdbT with pleckstrin-like domain